jgi:hypothetical protein
MSFAQMWVNPTQRRDVSNSRIQKWPANPTGVDWPCFRRSSERLVAESEHLRQAVGPRELGTELPGANAPVDVFGLLGGHRREGQRPRVLEYCGSLRLEPSGGVLLPPAYFGGALLVEPLLGEVEVAVGRQLHPEGLEQMQLAGSRLSLGDGDADDVRLLLDVEAGGRVVVLDEAEVAVLGGLRALPEELEQCLHPLAAALPGDVEIQLRLYALHALLLEAWTATVSGTYYITSGHVCQLFWCNLKLDDLAESLRDNNLVRERVFRWNPLCHNLLTLGNKLTHLGLVYSDGVVTYEPHAEVDRV